jgi:hypothetical protein
METTRTGERKMTETYAIKVLNDNMQACNGGNKQYQPGKTHTAKGEIRICSNGLHLTYRPRLWKGTRWFIAKTPKVYTAKKDKMVCRKITLLCELPKPARDAYNAAEETTNDAYNAALKPADDAYNAALKTANDAYDAAVKTARDAYYAALKPARDAYNAALEPARDAYNAALKPARDAYDAAVKTANDAYNAALKPADDAYNAAVKTARDACDAALSGWLQNYAETHTREVKTRAKYSTK